MKFTLALLGAIYLAEQVEGRRSKSYDATRAYAKCLNEDGDVTGKMELTQILGMDGMNGPVSVRSHFMDTAGADGDDWDLGFSDAADCGGSVQGTYDAMARPGRAADSWNVYTKVDSDSIEALSVMIDAMWSVSVIQNDSAIACCNIMEVERKTRTKTTTETTTISGALGTAQDAADQK